jgi:hypothetical protein
MGFYLKDPQARADYGLDWGPYLGARIIMDSGWTVQPAGEGAPVIEGSAFDLTGTSVTLSGGTAGCSYRVGNLVTLSDGQVDERSLTVRVEER